MSKDFENIVRLQSYSLSKITGDTVNNYVRSLVPEKQGFLKDIKDYSVENNLAIVTPEVGSLLELICQIINPKKIFEVGTCVGYSAFLMKSCCREIEKITTVERNPLMYNKAIENIKKYDKNGVINLVIGDALNILENTDEKFDLVFLDGAKGQYPNFLPHIERILNDGGILFADNILFKGMVASDEYLDKRRNKTIVRRIREFLDKVSSSKSFVTSILPIGDGAAVCLKKEQRNDK